MFVSLSSFDFHNKGLNEIITRNNKSLWRNINLVVTSQVFSFGCKADAEYPFQYSGSRSAQASIPCKWDYPCVPFCCHAVMLLLIHNSACKWFKYRDTQKQVPVYIQTEMGKLWVFKSSCLRNRWHGGQTTQKVRGKNPVTQVKESDGLLVSELNGTYWLAF